VAVGDQVAAGQPIGRAAMAERPRIGIELRRRGVPVDLAQLLG
jgi:septal ring factor EnvC (AmiA/AmiB activator)